VLAGKAAEGKDGGGALDSPAHAGEREPLGDDALAPGLDSSRSGKDSPSAVVGTLHAFQIDLKIVAGFGDLSSLKRACGDLLGPVAAAALSLGIQKGPEVSRRLHRGHIAAGVRIPDWSAVVILGGLREQAAKISRPDMARRSGNLPWLPSVSAGTVGTPVPWIATYSTRIGSGRT